MEKTKFGPSYLFDTEIASTYIQQVFQQVFIHVSVWQYTYIAWAGMIITWQCNGFGMTNNFNTSNLL